MTLTPKPHGFELRLRYGKGKRDRFLLRCDESTAKEREPRLEAMAHRLAATPAVAGALELLREAASVASDDRKFAAVERVVGKLCAEVAGDAPPLAASGTLTTFRDVALAWTSGKLTELYPDHDRCPPKGKQARAEDRQIVSTFFPALGSKPIADLRHEDIDAARRLIPKDLHANTRRIYAVKLRFVLRLAESPLRIVEHAVGVDIPKRRSSNLFGYLYPQEEALVLACKDIPLVYRMLYGYLTRNGCRAGESLQITWDHVDLETGDIRIDKRWTKTKVARRWVLDEDVRRAFGAYHKMCGAPVGKAFVFPGRTGKRVRTGTIWARLIKDLRLAGVTRKTLLEGGDGLNAIRVHDLRATFVTLALRAGRDTKWIMTRTGHETLGVLKGYDRLVQDAEEHHLPPWFTGMDAAIPELAASLEGGPRVGQAPVSVDVLASNRPFMTDDKPGKTRAKTSVKPTSVSHGSPVIPSSGPAENKGVGQNPDSGPPSADPADPVEQALSFAISEATRAQRWDVVLACSRELEQRRLARQSSNVTSLADHRSKKGDGK